MEVKVMGYCFYCGEIIYRYVPWASIPTPSQEQTCMCRYNTHSVKITANTTIDGTAGISPLNCRDNIQPTKIDPYYKLRFEENDNKKLREA